MITVIAGVNGAGKSSLIGNGIRSKGSEYYNPDEKTQSLMKDDSSLSLSEANGRAWNYGYEKLQEAIDHNKELIFETTLGGNSISLKLHEAVEKGVELSVIYCGLSSPELHIERVQARVQRGGHDIPEDKIRQRWNRSIHNVSTLIPKCKYIKVYDNSAPLIDGKPSPKLLIAMREGALVSPLFNDMPNWAKPLASIALTIHNSNN